MAKQGELPEVDNFYLDMNGIIHNCTHPCDGDVHFRLTEAEMFEDIFNYIETLFRIIKPNEIFFMAVDGVAPRAKMNQQRGRRFRSAKEASDREDAAIKKGDILPSEKRFDSNCITPGTEFMVKLNKALNEFIVRKLSSDRDWQRVRVVLSGHETPGEGEHKIMDFIRHQRSQPGYNPKTRHCLYGLDTDLIMLGLSSHEPHFTLLREEIKFTKKPIDSSRKPKSGRVDPSKIDFNVLFLDKLRKYLDEDFRKLEKKLRFKFDLESIIDDWILICFLVGNDFIPHIPHFHIHKDALPIIFGVYQETLPKLDGYMNEKGILNFKRFRMFAEALSKLDIENYQNLLKENGGDCAKDDFTKLNMFIKHKLKIHGIEQNGGNHHKFRGGDRLNNRASHHSHYHQTNDWYNIQNKNSNGRFTANGSSNYRERREQTNISTPNHQRSQPQKNPTHHITNGHHRTSNGVSGGVTSNGTQPKVGVHSFTEEQINNSITLCADGDFLDLSDEEFLSDEKFPGEPPRKPPAKNNPPPKNMTSMKSNGIKILSRSSNNKKQANEIDSSNGRKSKPSKDQENEDFHAYKRTYYKEKLKIDPTPENIAKVVQEYVRALQWNLHYYYHGCRSWGWYYPYHYAPFISDVTLFENVDIKFEMGEPFKPYDQLLSVLPAASSSLLPQVYRSLVTSGDSPLAKYFPTEVEFDLNGKQNDWEAVVLAPFIDEDSLLKASVLYNLFLTEREREVNNHGPHQMFYYELALNTKSKTGISRGSASAIGGEVKCIPIDKNEFLLPIDKIKFGLLDSEQDADNIKDSDSSTKITNKNNHKNHYNNNNNNSYNNNNTNKNSNINNTNHNNNSYNNHKNHNNHYTRRTVKGAM